MTCERTFVGLFFQPNSRIEDGKVCTTNTASSLTLTPEMETELRRKGGIRAGECRGNFRFWDLLVVKRKDWFAQQLLPTITSETTEIKK
jgi:hypothetical protein